MFFDNIPNTHPPPFIPRISDSRFLKDNAMLCILLKTTAMNPPLGRDNIADVSTSCDENVWYGRRKLLYGHRRGIVALVHEVAHGQGHGVRHSIHRAGHGEISCTLSG